MNKYKVVVRNYILHEAEVMVEANSTEDAREIAGCMNSESLLDFNMTDDLDIIQENVQVYDLDDNLLEETEPYNP
jgi:hypothetical protein